MGGRGLKQKGSSSSTSLAKELKPCHDVMEGQQGFTVPLHVHAIHGVQGFPRNPIHCPHIHHHADQIIFFFGVGKKITA